jgi:nitrous oxide reductase accessory protein NosL
MLIRHTALAAVMFVAVLAGCNKRNDAPLTPTASDASSNAPTTVMQLTPTPPAVVAPPAAAAGDAGAGGASDKKP